MSETATTTSQRDVWVWVEHADGELHPAMRELLGEARELADALGGVVGAVLLGSDVTPLARDLGPAGADRVFLIDAPDLDGYTTDAHCAALAALVASYGPPAALLCAQSANGADLAPRLAARLGASFLGDCIWLRPSGNTLRATRRAYDDRVHQEWELPAGRLAVVTYPAGIRGEPPPESGRTAEVVTCPEAAAAASAAPQRVRLIRTIQPEARTIGLRDAERVVAAGLGIGERDFLDEVQTLADLLGAALGASRPLADRGWVPFERQIGTTGQMISPKLYVALGISGAIQHVAGITGAETIVAVNSDRSAPMMAMATLGVVGRVQDIVPRLIERLRERSPADARTAQVESPQPDPVRTKEVAP